MFTENQAESRAVVVFGQSGLEIGGGDVVWATFVVAPLHEQAVTDAAHHAEEPDSVVMAHPAAVVVIRDIQALVEAVLDVPGLPVEAQPVLRIQARGLGAGHERHQFVFAALGLAQEQGGLLGQGKADLLTAEGLGANAAAFLAAFIDFLCTRRRRRRLQRGENPSRDCGMASASICLRTVGWLSLTVSK